MEKTSVLLLNDQAMVRAGLRALLEKIPTVQVVGDASLGARSLELIKRKRPAVVLLSTGECGLRGLETAAQVAGKCPLVRVLVMSSYASEEHIRQALTAGAVGYLLKQSAAGQLERAIRAVAQGKTFLCPTIPKPIRDSCRQWLRGKKGPLVRLTPRQRQILQLLAESKTTKEIAGLLQVSVKTVEFHRVELMKRLNIRAVPGLVRYAMRAGLIPLESENIP